MASEAQERTQFDSMVPWTGTFLNLDKPRAITNSNREVPKFSANFEIDKGSPEEARIRAAIVAEARKLWPNMDVGAAIREGRLNVPLSDGDKLADKAKQKSADTGKQRLRDWSRGKVVLIARSKDEYPPAVTFRENSKTVECETLDAVARAKSKFFYTGVQCLFGVRLSAYEAVGADGKPGVTAYLEAVESLGVGEKLIASRDRTARFSGYVGLESNEDPTGGDAGSDW
jgi:hypothetical protein